MTDPGWNSIDLGYDIFLRYRSNSSGGFDFQLWLGTTIELAQGSLTESNREAKLQVDLEETVRADLDLTLSPLPGEVLGSGDVEIWESSGWTTIWSFQNKLLFLYDPSSGLVNGQPTATPPAMPDQPWGKSGPSSGGGVTRIHISDQVRVGTDIGSKVKQLLFAGYPPLTLNIVACCGTPAGDGPNQGKGPYVNPDPANWWFNVFFGIYQIDCAKADGWARPFAYQKSQGINSEVQYEDIERIGKSDWNWISNFLYGVPEDICQQYSDIGKATFQPTTKKTIGSSQWHVVSMSNVTVASAYQSDASGARQLQENSPLTPMWRQAFGQPWPQPAFTTSFIPTTLQSTSFMAYAESEIGFSTLIFGGTSEVKRDPDGAFLAAQAQAAQQTIGQHYPTAGFPLS